MRLKEYQGKKLFKKYGILVPRGKLITSVQPDSSKLAKVQVLAGSRGKKGLIKPATKKNLEFLFEHCGEILLEERLKIDKEYYLALVVDREAKEIVVLFSEEGGIEVEKSEKMINIPYDKIFSFPQKNFLSIIESMYELMKDNQALLVEINPLVLSGGKLIAADAKVVLDDNADNPEFEEELTKLEKKAKESGLSYVDLDGEIAIVGNGAGLVMATLDVVDYFGGKAANFLDLGGGASKGKVQKALMIVSQKKPKLILINIFGGITQCDQIALGLVDYQLNIPLIVRIVGTNQELAWKILNDHKINVYRSMEKSVREAVKNVYSC